MKNMEACVDFAPETPFLYGGLAALALTLIAVSRYRLRRTGAALGLAGIAAVAAFLWMRRDAVGLAGLGLALIALELGRRRRRAAPAAQAVVRRRPFACEGSNDDPARERPGRRP